FGRGDPNDAVDLATGGQRSRAVRAGRAEVGGDGEAPLHERQAFGKVLRRAGEQEIRLSAAARVRPGAIEAAIEQSAIENPRGRGRIRHWALLMGQTASRAKLCFGLNYEDGRHSGGEH